MSEGATGEAVVKRSAAVDGRYEFTVELAGRDYDIWYQADRPLADAPEAALAACLVPAMRTATSLSVHAPVDPMLAERLDDIQGVYEAWEGQWMFETAFRRIPVSVASARPASDGADRGRLAFFSGGVDSYDLVASVPSITHLVFVGGFDIFVDDPALDAVHERLERAARRLGIPLIRVDTNIKELTDEHVPWLTCFGAEMASVAMLLAPVAASAHIGGTIPYGWGRPNGSHPLLDHLWSTSAVRIVSEGGAYTRMQKTARIADHPVARDHLRVCWAGPTEEFNCGRCEKCLRTMTMLEILGVRRHFRSFPPELDLEAVARLRLSTAFLYNDWRSAQQALRERGGAPELAEAIDECLRASRGVFRPRLDEIADLVRRLRELEERDRLLRTVLSSNSWRLTSPLRRTREVLRLPSGRTG